MWTYKNLSSLFEAYKSIISSNIKKDGLNKKETEEQRDYHYERMKHHDRERKKHGKELSVSKTQKERDYHIDNFMHHNEKHIFHGKHFDKLNNRLKGWK